MTTTPEPQCTGGAAIDHPETGVCNHAASEPAVPAVGDKYTCTTETGTRTVTVTRVGQNIDGPAVEFEWRDPQSPLCGAGLTLPVFLGTYKPAATPEPTADPWPTIARLTAWLDDRNGRSGAETALRLLKVTEEAGEVASAWIGMTGQNPRKGFTHTTSDVADELCDVITAAMVALATVTADPAAHFARKIAQIAALRLDTAGGEQ